jgi:thiamine pyrophosphate-dependent acetolactate synthase large subunit-like protein
MPEIQQNPMLNMRPNTLIYGARHDKMMQAFGGYGAHVEDTEDVRGALDADHQPEPADRAAPSPLSAPRRRIDASGT